MMRYLDIKKTIEVIVYISQSTKDLFHIMKVLYYADKFHLENYGRFITGDHYIAMDNGPVPSGAYDIIKSVRGDGFIVIDEKPEEAFAVEGGRNVIPLRAPNFDYFSESDIECLDKSISIYAKMDINELWKLVHEEEPFIRATRDRDSEIPSEYIIRSLVNGDEILEYLNS